MLTSFVSSIDVDAFTIQHVNTTMCLVANADKSLALANCTNPPGSDMNWKWGSGHRLFHVGSSQCLGLEVYSKKLLLSGCESTNTILKWLCVGQAIYTEYEMGLTSDGKTVVVKHQPTDSWRRGGLEENICQQPFKSKGRKAHAIWLAYPHTCQGPDRVTVYPHTHFSP